MATSYFQYEGCLLGISHRNSNELLVWDAFSEWLCLAGTWETKVSNREKRQQRKKEKGPGDSSESPEGGVRASQKVEQPAVTAPAGTKKNKGMHFLNSVLVHGIQENVKGVI